MSHARGDAALIATGSPGRSVADAGSTTPMAAHRSGLLCAWTTRAFATPALTMWLTLLLLYGAWTRPIGEAVRVWAWSLPFLLKEPAHIIALGHPRDAEDLRPFITAVLVFSLGVAFVTAGPGRREFIEWWLLNPVRSVRSARDRTWRGVRARHPFRVALGQALSGGCVLAMFAGAGILDVGLGGYWRIGCPSGNILCGMRCL